MIKWQGLAVVLATAIGSVCVTLLAVSLIGEPTPQGSEDARDGLEGPSTTGPSPFPPYSIPDREVLELGESFDFKFDWAGFMWDANIGIDSSVVESASPDGPTDGVAIGERVLVVVDVRIRVSEGEFPVGRGDFKFLPQGGEFVDPERGIYPDPRTDGPLRAGSEFAGKIGFLVQPSDAESGQVCLRDIGVRRVMRACWNLDIGR